MIKTSHLSHPSLLHIEMNTSHSDDKLMPEPSNLNDPRWKSLPSLLNDSVLARFDQSRCTNNHGIHERAMCFGLSLSWLEKVKKDGSHANHYAAAERMNYLASFDGVVNSRILHNFYRHEHAFQIKLATASGDISKASLAGTESLIQAAEYKNIKLKPRLENQLSKDMPFLTMVKTSERYLKDDDAAFDTFNSALADAKRGIMAIGSCQRS
ncbi:hypothetical protein PCO82_06385 [Pectobacteriaceae bacterium CE90]|nr:hypothetical protein PCO82_06385 [Pectobacteriaceae bacterium CE90]